MGKTLLSLEEAQKQANLKQFANEHPSKGDEEQFDELLEKMATDSSPSPQTQCK